MLCPLRFAAAVQPAFNTQPVFFGTASFKCCVHARCRSGAGRRVTAPGARRQDDPCRERQRPRESQRPREFVGLLVRREFAPNAVRLLSSRDILDEGAILTVINRKDEMYGDPDGPGGEWMSARFGLAVPVSEDSPVAVCLVEVARATGHHGVFRLVESDLVGGIRVPIHLAADAEAELRARHFSVR